MKVKIRLQGDLKELEKVKEMLLERCPELILGSPRKGTNPKYADNQKYASYGDFEIGKKRRRKNGKKTEKN